MLVIIAKTTDTITVLGDVVTMCNHNLFKVKLKDSTKVIEAQRGGKMQKNDINIIQGDEVQVVINKYNLNRGRIVFRSTANRSHISKK